MAFYSISWSVSVASTRLFQIWWLYSRLLGLEELVYPHSVLFNGLLAILVCIFFHTNVNNTLHLIFNDSIIWCQIEEATEEPTGTFALTVNNSSNEHHGRDLDPGRGLKTGMRKVMQVGDKLQLRTRSWESQVVKSSNRKARSCG